MKYRKPSGGRPAAFLSFALAAILLVPVTASGQRKKSSKTRLSRDEQIEAALRKRTQKIQDQYCRDLVRVANWAALQGLKKDATGLVNRIRKINPGYSKLDDVVKKIEKAEEETDADKNADESTGTCTVRQADTDIRIETDTETVTHIHTYTTRRHTETQTQTQTQTHTHTQTQAHTQTQTHT